MRFLSKNFPMITKKRFSKPRFISLVFRGWDWISSTRRGPYPRAQVSSYCIGHIRRYARSPTLVLEIVDCSLRSEWKTWVFSVLPEALQYEKKCFSEGQTLFLHCYKNRVRQQITHFVMKRWAYLIQSEEAIQDPQQCRWLRSWFSRPTRLFPPLKFWKNCKTDFYKDFTKLTRNCA